MPKVSIREFQDNNLIRAEAYLSAGDQLDGILKGFESLKEAGHVFPQGTLDVMDHWRGVKEALPTPKDPAGSKGPKKE